MALYKDLQWMEDELLEDEDLEEEEEEYEEEPPRRWRRKAPRPEPVSMADREAIYVEKKKKQRVKGVRRLKFLAFLEFLAIVIIAWGWIKWLY